MIRQKAETEKLPRSSQVNWPGVPKAETGETLPQQGGSKKLILKVVLWPPHMNHGMCTPIHTHTHRHKHKLTSEINHHKVRLST